jgi:hypothetical protein
LTHYHKVPSGSELIELGIRDCDEPKTNEPKIMVASAAAGKPPVAAQPGAEKPLLAGLMDKMLWSSAAAGRRGTIARRFRRPSAWWRRFAKT